MSNSNALEQEVKHKDLVGVVRTVVDQVPSWDGRTIFGTYMKNCGLELVRGVFDPFRHFDDILSRKAVNDQWVRSLSILAVAVLVGAIVSLVMMIRVLGDDSGVFSPHASFFAACFSVCLVVDLFLANIIFYRWVIFLEDTHYKSVKYAKQFFVGLGVILPTADSIKSLVELFSEETIRKVAEDKLVELACAVDRLETESAALAGDPGGDNYSREKIDIAKDKEKEARDKFREYHRLVRKYGLAERSEVYFARAQAIREKREAAVNF